MAVLLAGDYFDSVGQARRCYGRALEPVCRAFGLTRNEMDVVLFLHNNPEFRRAADIVRHRGMAKSHVSLSVSSLERQGFLRRRFAEGDRRAAYLELTEIGLAVAREGRAVQEDFFRRLFDGISREELALWQEMTRRVQRNIEAVYRDLEG